MGSEERKRIASYRDLRVYQQAYLLALEIHNLTRGFPAFERRELGSQLRRAATSIPINIAEGYGRKRSPEDFKHFLVVALGSCNEVVVVLDLAHDLGYLPEPAHTKLKQQCDELGKGINKLIQVWR